MLGYTGVVFNSAFFEVPIFDYAPRSGAEP
ncbi:hypothetical protein SAMN06265373_11064 [Shimia sagamensis]|uniref:Uncharacterized protein n=1 Tax=Shimia sagamensis TaxID=1566352 RepID=A0ABY1PK94_9RHOB|nr:hypothetical protein SAMN06265373_11064 [Shimia sagamensis]